MRVRLTLFAGCIATLVFVVAPPGRADDASTLKAAFLRDYPRAVEALEAHSVRAMGVVRRTVERHISKGRKVASSTTLEFECKLPHMARVIGDGELAVTKGDVTKSKGTWRVRCYNDDYSFELGKQAASGKYSVTSFLDNAEGKSKNEKRFIADLLLRYLGAPFYLDLFPMSQLLAAKNVSVRSVSRVRAGGRQLLRAEFEMRPARKGWVSLAGWFTVSPDEAWVIHEYEFVDQGKTSVHGSMEYAGLHGGVPVLRRFALTVTAQGPKSTVLRSATTYDFEKLDFVDVPDRDFTLAAFGLPELGRSAARPSGGAAPWLITFSLLTLAAAAVLKVASSRLQRKEELTWS